MVSVFDDLLDPIETESDVFELLEQKLGVAEHHIEVVGRGLKEGLEFALDVKFDKRDAVIMDVFD